MGANIDLLFEQARMALTAGVRPGDVLVGKYRVDSILGMGGMGVVIAAHHLKLDERVAIKLLLPEALSHPQAVKRFEREARAAVKIKSEHSARILDVGTLDDGAPYMVMEYLEGEDLATRIARMGPFDIEDAVEILLQASEAIAEAHALGIVHRDLKPANLFCIRGPDGRTSVKVLDFGISKLTRPGDAATATTMTNTNIVLGSPFYMSPEQMQGSENLDARADVWSLGVILYQLLTGDVPFAGDTWPQVCACVATRPAPRLRRFRPDARPALEAVVARCLEKDPRKRYPDVAALATDLAPFAPKHGRTSVSRISLAARHASLPASTVTIPPRTARNDAERARRVSSWRVATAPAPRFQLHSAGWAVAGALAVVAISVVWSRADRGATTPSAAGAPFAAPVQPSGLPLERITSAAQDSLPVAATPPPTPVEPEVALPPGASRSPAGGRAVHPPTTKAPAPAALLGGRDGGAAIPLTNEDCALCQRQ